jgi:hypothetical protein
MVRGEREEIYSMKKRKSKEIRGERERRGKVTTAYMLRILKGKGCQV